jgi:hypothetical protein
MSKTAGGMSFHRVQMRKVGGKSKIKVAPVSNAEV